MKEMNTLLKADDLVNLIENCHGQSASVHSVFEHAVNLLVYENELITITHEGEITPMGLTVASSEKFSDFIQPGDSVRLEIDAFTSDNGPFRLNLGSALVWESGAITDQATRTVEEVDTILLLLIEWLGRQPALGLLPLLPQLIHPSAAPHQADHNAYSRYIADDLVAFADAIAAGDWQLALQAADKLVGFGMGSTPSCDDFLAAYLVVFNIAGMLNPGVYPWVKEFNNTIAEKARRRTTLISAAMLRHAGKGRLSSSHQQLVQSCIFTSEHDPIQSARQVLKYGATSGGDFLLGFVFALTWYRNSMMDYPKEGEKAWVASEEAQLMQMV